MNHLYRATVRLARLHPELRPHLLPVLKQARMKRAHGPVALKNPEVMLYAIDQEKNQSKFYEMAVVPYGLESVAQKNQKGFQGMPTHVLMRRWGRLTDSGVSGRVDSINELHGSERAARVAMGKIKMDKMRGRGSAHYTDVSSTRRYPIGLGAAGFGWGGQAACSYIPELRELQAHLAKMNEQLRQMGKVTSDLSRQKSSLVPDLVPRLNALSSPLEDLESYLQEQLAHCR